MAKIEKRVSNESLILKMIGLSFSSGVPMADSVRASGVLCEGTNPNVGYLMEGKLSLGEFVRLVNVPKSRVVSKI